MLKSIMCLLYLSLFSVTMYSQANTYPFPSTGNVGIGVASAGTTLQVNGTTSLGDGYDGTSYGLVQIVRPSAQPDNKFHLSFIRNGMSVSGMGYMPNSNTIGIWHANSNAGTPGLAITTDQRVGIGTATPAEKLTIAGTEGNIFIGSTTYGGWNGICLNGEAGFNNYNFLSKQTDHTLYINRPDGATIRFRKANSDQVIIHNNGGVDIISPDNDGATRLRVVNLHSTGANAAGSFPAIEVLGARGDGNPTFEGRLALGTRRTDGNALTNQALGAVLFGGQYGNDQTLHPLKIRYAASIKGLAEGSFNDAATMPTGIAFFTGSTGDDVGTGNLLYGTERMRITSSGNIGIGTSAPGPYKLAVEGTIAARKVKVTQVNPWADYVFENDYPLRPLAEVEQFILQHKHLPDVPSAAEVAKEGLDLGDNQAVLLRKIEELTLYILEMKKENTAQQVAIKKLELLISSSKE